MIIGEKLDLHYALKNFFGFDKFKGRQEEIIGNILDGKDTFVIMPTGGGKSLCYQLPALVSEGTAIIISPLIALMKNQVDSIRSFGSEDGIAHFLNSSLSKAEITGVKDDIMNSKTKMLFVAPESLNKAENIDFFRGIKVSFVAVDEAHCISEWGHDFRPEYRQIRTMVKAIDTDVPIIALTATATPKVQMDIMKNLGMDDAVVYKDSFNRPNLYYEVRPKVNVLKEIIKFVKRHSGKSGIIYCLSRKKVEELANNLVVNGIKALPYHAGMDAQKRARNQDMFLMEEADIIVATIAFGMGIDKPDVRFVIHHDIPKSLEGYYQETGRSGRDGGEGHCLAFYSHKDIEKLEKFMHGKPLAEQEIGRQLLNETVSYAETSVCRRKFLLHYFGESFEAEDCNKMCDNCRHPKEKFKIKDEMVLMLEVVLELKERFKARHICNFLVGKATTEIKNYKQNTHEDFGKGKDKDDKFWQAVIRQALISGLLAKDIEHYGLLKLCEKGKHYIENPVFFEMARDHDYTDSDDNDDILVMNGKGNSGAVDEQLFNALKDLRRKMAQQRSLPPFVIFQDPSLEDMSTQYPITHEELCNITGVGEGKARKFGKAFLDLIGKYVDENEIERPQDMVVKSVVNKSGQKVFIIHSTDRKIPLPDIASSKGLSFDELITELENIVHSGTKLNFDYYLNEILDEERQEEVLSYFAESENDSIDAAMEELGDEYDEDELRLMRIKFYSDVGN